MSTVLKAHREDLVTGLEHGEIDRGVGLTARVWLNVCVFGSEKFLGSFDGQAFGDVDVFASPIVAFGGITLGVLVGQNAPGCFDYGRQGEVFRGDQLEVRALPDFFIFDDGKNGRVEFRQSTPV